MAAVGADSPASPNKALKVRGAGAEGTLMKRQYAVILLCLVSACGRLTCSQERHRAIRYMNAGVKAYADGLYPKALADLKKAVGEDDGYVTAHYNLAKVYQVMDRWEDAQRHLVRVTVLEPQNALAYYELGLCNQMLQRWDDARAAYDKSLSLQPNRFVVYYRLGMLSEAEKKPKEADAAYRRAIQLNPRFPQPFVKLGQLYLQHDYPELASQVLQSGASINPDNAQVHKMLGLAYQTLQQYEQAIESLEKALALKEDMYDALYNLGMAYAAADKPKKAEQTLTRFTRTAAGRKGVDPEYVRAAHDKISEIRGAALHTAAPPSK